MAGAGRKLVRVVLYLFEDQRRELRQRAFNGDSNGSKVARDLLDTALGKPATPPTAAPTPLGHGREEVTP